MEIPEKSQRRKRTKRKPVLADHRRKGTKLIPPYVALLGRPENVSWASTIVPEVIWIATLHHVFGNVVGTELALNLARSATERAPRTDHRFFAAASDFTDLSVQEKDAIRTDMSGSGQVVRLQRAFATVCRYYPMFPLAFLCDDTTDSEVDLDTFKKIVRALFDKELPGTVFVASTVVYLAFVLDRLKVAEGLALAKFPEVERYPHTELSRRIASAVRATVLSFFGPSQRKAPAAWPVQFWNRGIEIDDCVF